MTRDQFCDALAEIVRERGWRAQTFRIETLTSSGPHIEHVLRLIPPDGASCHCPVTAVATEFGSLALWPGGGGVGVGLSYVDQWDRAGEALGMKREDARLIAGAADFQDSESLKFHLRRRLFGACGLTPPEDR